MWKTHIFVKTCLYDVVGSLPVMPSLLPHGLWGRSQVSLCFASVVSPDDHDSPDKWSNAIVLHCIKITQQLLRKTALLLDQIMPFIWVTSNLMTKWNNRGKKFDLQECGFFLYALSRGKMRLQKNPRTLDMYNVGKDIMKKSSNRDG